MTGIVAGQQGHRGVQPSGQALLGQRGDLPEQGPHRVVGQPDAPEPVERVVGEQDAFVGRRRHGPPPGSCDPTARSGSRGWRPSPARAAAPPLGHRRPCAHPDDPTLRGSRRRGTRRCRTGVRTPRRRRPWLFSRCVCASHSRRAVQGLAVPSGRDPENPGVPSLTAGTCPSGTTPRSAVRECPRRRRRRRPERLRRARAALLRRALAGIRPPAGDRPGRAVLPGEPVTSVTIIDRGSPSTAAASGELALTLDETQYRLGSGPCLAAAATGRPQRARRHPRRDGLGRVRRHRGRARLRQRPLLPPAGRRSRCPGR